MVKAENILRAGASILSGRRPVLSIEITKICPLHCPGCYAFDPAHLGSPMLLRELSDYRGEALVTGVLALVDRLRPLHVSLVGGDPLVRWRELGALLPQLSDRCLGVQLVTSAFRPIPRAWGEIPKLDIAVSVDGLPAEHDARRAPATYERLLRHIQGHHVTIHCTITAAMLRRAGYLEEFVAFWSAHANAKRIWFSIFTPQRGATDPEIPSPEARSRAITEMLRLREIYPRLDMSRDAVEAFRHPPLSPQDCVFARVTDCISADLRTRISPCQFGGDPDCSRCGCLASMGMAAVADYRLPGGLRAGGVFDFLAAVGARFASSRVA